MFGEITLRSPDKSRPAGTRLFAEALEARLTPATQLLSTDFSNAAALPTGAEVVGESTDGRYVIFQSTATNVVRNQLPTPSAITGATNLYWQDTLTGERYLVSAERGSGMLRGGGVVPSVPGQTANAVISGDGKTVAFVSTRNANFYYSTTPTLPSISTIADNGDVSPDVFVWSSTTARAITTATNNATFNNTFLTTYNPVALVSREASNTGLNGVFTSTAIGFVSSATNPAINNDGTIISFVSSRNADAVDPFFAIQDNGDNTPDLFRAQITQLGSLNLTTVQFPFLVDIYTDPLTFQATAFGKFAGFLSVDPLGRYMGGDGLSYAVISTLPPSFIDNTAPTSPPGSQEVYHISASNTFTNLNRATSIGLMTSAAGISNQSVGAIAQDAIIPRTNPNAVVFAASVPGGANSLVPGYVNQNGGGTDLYYRSVRGNSNNQFFFFFGNSTTFAPTDQAILVSAAAGSGTDGANATIDLSTGSFAASGDGTKIVFATAANNLVSGLSDTNGATDIFVRDMVTGLTSGVSVLPGGKSTGNGPSSSPRITDDGFIAAFESQATNLVLISDRNGVSDVFVRDLSKGRTAAASAGPSGGATGNAKSFGIFVGGSLTGGQVAFTSLATDLTRGPTPPTGVDQVYVVTFPLITTDVSRVVAVAGGRSGMAGLATFAADGSLLPGAPIIPFPGFSGSVRAAAADVNGDGVPDLIVGAGPGGGPNVKVYDGSTGEQLYSFFPFEPTFTGGVYVGGADFDGDGKAEIVIGAGENGGPRIKIFDGATGSQVADLFVFEATFRGGVRVATGDVNGDKTPDLIAAAGEGGGPRIKVISGVNLTANQVLLDYFAFEPSLRNGVFASAGDVTGDGKADIATGAGPGGAPRVIVFDAAQLLNPVIGSTTDGQIVDFYAFPAGTRDGVRVALRNVDGSGAGGLVTGIGGGSPEVNTFTLGSRSTATAPQQLSSQLAFDDPFGFFGAWVG